MRAVHPGFRYYPSKKGAFNGFYIGGDFAFDVYKVRKWDHWDSSSITGGTDIQHGIGYYLCFTLGYQMPVAKHWNIDFYAGGGWHLGKYWREKSAT